MICKPLYLSAASPILGFQTGFNPYIFGETKIKNKLQSEVFPTAGSSFLRQAIVLPYNYFTIFVRHYIQTKNY
jgi:hypothetical protein